jgi:hypothetical protein
MFTIEVGDEVCLLTYCRMMELHRTLRANLTKAERKMLPPLNLQFDDLLRSPLNPWTVGAVIEVGLPPATKTLIYNKGVQIYRYSNYAEYGDVLYRLETRHFSGKQYLKRTYWIDAELLMDNISPDKITKEQEAIIEDYQKYTISFWTSKLKENSDSTTLDKVIKLETIVENFLDDLDGVDVPVKKKSRKISLTKTGKLTKSSLDHCEPLSDDLATFGEEEKPQMNWRIRKKGFYEVEEVRKSLEKGELYFYTEEEIQKMRDLNDKMYGEA